MDAIVTGNDFERDWNRLLLLRNAPNGVLPRNFANRFYSSFEGRCTEEMDLTVGALVGKSGLSLRSSRFPARPNFQSLLCPSSLHLPWAIPLLRSSRRWTPHIGSTRTALIRPWPQER